MGRQECLVAPCTSGGRHDVDLGTGDTGQTHRMQEVTSFLSLARLSVSSSPAVEQGQPGSSLLSAWPAVLGCGFSSFRYYCMSFPELAFAMKLGNSYLAIEVYCHSSINSLVLDSG